MQRSHRSRAVYCSLYSRTCALHAQARMSRYAIKLGRGVVGNLLAAFPPRLGGASHSRVAPRICDCFNYHCGLHDRRYMTICAVDS